MTHNTIFDLETYSVVDRYRRSDHIRLGGYTTPTGNRLTTSGDEIAKAIAEGTGPVGGHNVFAYDFPLLALHHGLDLTKLIGRAWDTDNLVRLDDPPLSGKDQMSIMPVGYYGLDQSCQRYGLPHKTDSLPALAGAYERAVVAMEKIANARDLLGGELTPARRKKLETDIRGWEQKISWLSEQERQRVLDLVPAASRYGKRDKYGLIPTTSEDYRSYLDGDLDATSALIDHLLPMDDYAQREMTVGLITSQIQVNGFKVNRPEVDDQLAKQAVRRQENLTELHQLTGMPLKGVTPIRSKEGNLALAQSIIRLGINDKALPRSRKTGMFATGKDDLGEFAEKIKKRANGQDVVVLDEGKPTERLVHVAKILRILDLVVKVSGERSVYQSVDKWDVNGRINPTYRPTQASGRWSATDVGVTVLGKRNGKFVERGMLEAEEGHVQVCFDADQVDMRSVAALSGDENYLEIFRSGTDPHTAMALEFLGSADRRDEAKPFNHGFNYGLGVNKMVEDGMLRSTATRFFRGMHEMYPGVIKWQDEAREMARAGLLLDNGFGRKLRAHPAYAYTQGPALEGQGCTRDIIAEWMLRLPVEFWPYIRGIIHDELVFSLPERDAEEMSRIIVAAGTFDTAEVTNGRLHSCPITVGMSRFGRTWADCYRK